MNTNSRENGFVSNAGLSGRRGAILLMVLVLIAVVSFVLVIFVERAEVEVKSDGYYLKRSELRMDAWSMMEVAVAVIADVKAIDGTLYAPAQGWSNPLDYAQITPRESLQVSFEFFDESSKMNLNELDESSLLLLFDALGFDLDVSMRLSGVLQDWVDEDDDTRIEGAESREYSTLDLEVHPANQPLSSLDELRYLFGFDELFFDEKGQPLPVFYELESAVTTLDVGTLNINGASPLALRAMADFDDIAVDMVDDYLAGLDGVIGTTDDNFFATTDEMAAVVGELPSGTPLGNEISVLTIKVTVSESGYSYSLIGTINTTTEAPELEESAGNLNYPFLFIQLREEPGENNARPT